MAIRTKKTAVRKGTRRPASLVPPAVGEYWEGQGGIYAGIGRLGDHIILHPDFCKKARFGAYGTSIKGAEDPFDGRKNTAVLLKVKGIELRLTEIMALKVDGHQDFFVPARFQSALLYANLRDKFDLGDWYWTSTQYSGSHAWGQYFYDGTQYNLYEGTEYYVRPVRSVLINSPIR